MGAAMGSTLGAKRMTTMNRHVYSTCSVPETILNPLHTNTSDPHDNPRDENYPQFRDEKIEGPKKLGT